MGEVQSLGRSLRRVFSAILTLVQRRQHYHFNDAINLPKMASFYLETKKNVFKIQENGLEGRAMLFEHEKKIMKPNKFTIISLFKEFKFSDDIRETCNCRFILSQKRENE